MPGGLFIRISQLDHDSVAEGSSQEADPHWKILGSKSSRYGDGGNEDQEGVQVGNPFVGDIGRIDPRTDQGGLMLDRLVYDGIQLVIRHDLQKVGHQFLSGQQELIMLGGIHLTFRQASQARLSGRKYL